MSDQAVSATHALPWCFGWIRVLIGDPIAGIFHPDWTQLVNDDGHGGLYLRPGARDGGIRSLVTVELTDTEVVRPGTTLAYQGSMVIGDGPEDGKIYWIGGDGAPMSWAPFRVPAGAYRMTVQVSGREESDALVRAFDEEHPDPDDPAEGPEPVEHWWVSFLSERPVS